MGITTHLGVAPLSAITTPPDEFVLAAHVAGFSAVGLRLMPVSPTDAPFPLDLRSPEFARIQRALESTGTEVLDIEVLSVTPQLERDDWLPMMEVGAALGASYLNVVCDEPSAQSFLDTMVQVTADAHDHGLQPVLEPVAYRPLNDFARAFEIARSIGCAVELDALHFLRTGASLETIRANADLVPVFQLCDAPRSIGDHTDFLQSLATDDCVTALEIAESRGRRLLPGEGAVPIKQLLAELPATLRVSVEIPNVELRANRSTVDYLRLLYRAAHEYLSVEPANALR